MPDDHANQTGDQGFTSVENPLASQNEQVEKLVNILARNFSESGPAKPARGSSSTSQAPDLPGRDLELIESWLTEAHRSFREESRPDLALTPASEWILDNFYVIRQALQQIHEDLPAGYYRQLPKVSGGPLADFPRIYAISQSVLAYQHLLLNLIDLQVILVQLQGRVSLTMGELWALPIFLRYSLVEKLAHILEKIIPTPRPSHLPAALQPFGTGELEVLQEVTTSGTPGSREVDSGGLVANIILSLRTISEQDWNDFFESVSRVEATLQRDPAEIYPLMDFKTRDQYRKEIELLSFSTGRDENELAEIVLDLANQESLPGREAMVGAKTTAHPDPSIEPKPGPNGFKKAPGPHKGHVGFYLWGKGRAELEERIGYRPNVKTAVKRWGSRHAHALYAGSILLLALLILIITSPAAHLPASTLAPWPASPAAQWIAVLITTILLVPALTVATNLVNWLVTLLKPPRLLPKLDFKDEIPAAFQTMVVIPALITGRDEIDSLIRQLELHYLRNPEPGLLFALLTDFSDADQEVLPEDEDLLQYATAGIESLNTRYEQRPFYFFHRKRLWNPAEGKWMGWERKRGKLHELNSLLRGKDGLSFSSLAGDLVTPCGGEDQNPLSCVRFVITLDADTILPPGAARRLVGTLAHPLNRAVIDDSSGRVISGYTVLQPRMEINPKSVNHSRFTQIFAGDTGLDLYTHAVSDAYQDLFGEGSYVGKGIYDVDDFERCVDGHIPENSVLSHDLLEGIMGRAGLVTDITMIEDYPPNYFVQVMRQRRWIRGDWQLLPWLFQPARFGVYFSAIDRWKVFDNLVRSLLSPALLLIFILGLIFLPGLSGLWVAIVLLSLGVPLLTTLAWSTLRALEGGQPGSVVRPLEWNLLRWLLAVAFLPYEAFIALDAIFTTLYRLLISHRKLLQWTTAAQTTRMFGRRDHQKAIRLNFGGSALLAVVLAAGVQLVNASPGSGIAPALAFAMPILLLWALSPLIAGWTNRPIALHSIPLSEEQISRLRQVSRRTWSFFERFAGPEDHWLPPDNFQESPAGRIAHHTSPTNIGLLLTSTLGAYDLGYLDQLGLATRLANTMDVLERLERFRGHFMNWYDTLNLQPLQPRYISMVDSGNLAACLIITIQACQAIPEQPIFRWELWQGYLDTLSNLSEILSGMQKAGPSSRQVEVIDSKITEIRAEILASKSAPERWYSLYQKVSTSFWKDLSQYLIELVEAGHPALNLEKLHQLQEAAAQVERQHLALRRIFSELAPWISVMEQRPAILEEPQFLQPLAALQANLLYNPALCQIRARVEDAQPSINTLRELLQNGATSDRDGTSPTHNEWARDAREWLEGLSQALSCAAENSDALVERFATIAAHAGKYANEMDFKFLYHPRRRVFHLGFNLDTGQLDRNYYDLLASEARITSIIAIARGEVPLSHWLQLSRPVTRVEGFHVLLSWSATMFEYLMPPLFLTSYPGTLLADSALGAVKHQIAYGKAKGVPWGISESGFYQFDANLNYQYRAFGVPGLGFKRGLADDLVIAPYASLLAIAYAPQAVLQNLETLIERGLFGRYGFYEAIDFTSERQPVGKTSAVISEYMVHHQGMILMAITNFFHGNIMVQRMHRDARIQSVDLLLQELVPQAVPLQDPYTQDVKGVGKMASAQVKIEPWKMPLQTPIPEVHLLSNGSYSVLVSNTGGGYSTWRDLDLTRWQADGVLDPWGTWIYIQQLGSGSEDGKLWSAGWQPVPGRPEDMQVTYLAYMAVFRRTENGITSTLEVTVAPDDPVEVRRLHLHNPGDHAYNLRLASYGEVVLSQQATDARHPAFNKMFIENEFVPELNLQIFRRRPRSGQEKPVFLGHMLVNEDRDLTPAQPPTVRYEADRYRFIGRGHTLRAPAALISAGYEGGTTGATLDPIFSLGQEITLKPHGSARLAYLTFAAESRDDILALARSYRSWTIIERSFHRADITAQAWLSQQNLNTGALQNYLQVLSALLYPFKAARAAPETIAANRLGQPGLWRFGISGDYPILLVDVDSPGQVDLAREALQLHKFLHSRGFKMDVVILNHQQTNYGAELKARLNRLASQVGSEQWLNQRGGIFFLHADQINPEERILLQTAARLVLSGQRGSLGEQMPGYTLPTHHLPEFIPTRSGEGTASDQEDSLPPAGPLQFYNGYGGFTADGREYVIELPPGRPTPAPWVNVIGYPHFGFMVTESGSQCTWAINSGENRLTPWSNDPVLDPTGEALYLRDEETGEVWSPTPLPASAGRPYRVKHGAGYTIFEHTSHGLNQRLTLFSSPEDPVKIIHLQVVNTWGHTRRITATEYVEWVLGTTRAASLPYLIPEYDPARECLLTTNPYNQEFGKRTAFLIANKPIHGLTADRIEFLGRSGTTASPAALHRLGLEARITPGEEPCAVLQLHLDLLPGATEEIYFVLGQGADRENALALADKYHDPAYIGAAWERTQAIWDRLLGAIQVHTPEPAADLILNRWLVYQTLSCRVWGRTAFYQSSGAFGFRDQLQDVLAVLSIDPTIARGQILNAAQHQFEAGDVLHWWHPPSGRGVRTLFSDDLLWLPYVTAQYVEVTGDRSILEEAVPFLKGSPLEEGEKERYNLYSPTEKPYPLLEHCHRAVSKGATVGPHGLALIGTGDWNDGFNRVGEGGRGESIWLTWFLCDVLGRFAALCEQGGDSETAERLRNQARDYAAAVERSAWDGSWYRRAYYDDGATLGSSRDLECQIDAIAQSWAVISGKGDPRRSRQAMASVVERLVRPQDRLVLLFTPPFDETQADPGYIKGYPPGTRENGGQYTHAATWTAWAFTLLGDGNQAGALFNLLNPILQSSADDHAGAYRVEPYVICADIYSMPPYLGRGGWTWYTGSAAWMYRLGLEAILGLRKAGNRLHITPVIPSTWEKYEIVYRFGKAVYRIQVNNPAHFTNSVQIILDGKPLTETSIPLVDDGQEHLVEVRIAAVAMEPGQG